uniref:Uncharacterized protein n=1 Tax=Hyaloperonospora arabidopsidis (strain Emoy2) TaxID=559515 RepID=M4B8D1_HYAAE
MQLDPLPEMVLVIIFMESLPGAYGPQSRQDGKRSRASSCRTASKHSTMFHGMPGYFRPDSRR